MQNDLMFLAIKLVSIPVFVSCISIVAHKRGPLAGGLLVSLPVNSAPVLLFLSLEQGNTFASSAAYGMLMAQIPLIIFCLVYSTLCVRLRWLGSFLGSFTVYSVFALFIQFLYFTPVIVFMVIFSFVLIIVKLMPPGNLIPGRQQALKLEITFRIVVVTILIFLVTEVAPILGPNLSGLLTMFPIYAATIGASIHNSEGATCSALFLKGVVRGQLALAFFFFVYASLILQMTLPFTIMITSISMITVQVLLLYLTRS